MYDIINYNDGGIMKEITVKKLLENHELYTSEIQRVSYHLNINGLNPRIIVKKMTGLVDLTEEELAKILYELIRECNADAPYYKYDVDEEMTRICLKTDEFSANKFSNYDSEVNYPKDFVNDGYIDYQDSGKSL